MKLKITAIVSALALLCTPAFARQTGLALLISGTDGSSTGFCLNEMPVLSFTNSELVVKFQGNTETFPKEDIRLLSYVNASDFPTGITAPSANPNFSVTYYENGVAVITPVAQNIIVCNVSGAVLLEKQANENSRTEISYSDFPAGVYILKCGNHSCKFFVK